MKMLRIDMSNLSTKTEAKKEYDSYGGRALTSRIIFDELDPGCYPLGEFNKIILAPGLLSGTTAPCSGRLSIGAKSPLTGTIKEANSGGTAAQKLAKLGYGAVIIEGEVEGEELYIIKLNSEGVEFIRANGLKCKGTYDTAEALRRKYGRQYSVICIGPAGEAKLLTAGIAITNIKGEPSRMAARGGLGAVLGARGVKAIIVNNDNKNEIAYEDFSGFKGLSSSLARELIKSKEAMTKYGTAVLVDVINSLKGLPTHNFSRGQFDGVDKINGEELRRRIIERGGKPDHPCHPGCVIRCSNVYNDENGSYLTSGFEYETIALTGANCGIDDLDTIARIDRFCDDMGIDTMDTGAAIGVLMEAGILKFGDSEGVMQLLGEIRELTPMGRVIGSGAYITGRVFGVKRVPVVKRQALSAYDPRVFKGTGVTYATSPMGADHTAGNCLPGRDGYRKESREVEINQGDNTQIALSSDIQVMTSVCDSLGFCFFVGPSLDKMKTYAGLLNMRYGTRLSYRDLLRMGEETIKIERQFNQAAGISRREDRLPEFFSRERIDDHIFDLDEEEIIEKIFDF